MLLDLTFNYIGDAGAAALAELLATTETLVSLGVGLSKLSDTALVSLAGALRDNTTVERLNICSNSAGTAGMLALAEALRHNTTLQHINITDLEHYTVVEPADPAGGIAVAEALGANSGLLSFQWYGPLCVPRDEGVVEALALALRSNTSLRMLDIRFVTPIFIGSLLLRWFNC